MLCFFIFHPWGNNHALAPKKCYSCLTGRKKIASMDIIRLMVQKSCGRQLRLVVYPISYNPIPSMYGIFTYMKTIFYPKNQPFLPWPRYGNVYIYIYISQVVGWEWDFWTINRYQCLTESGLLVCHFREAKHHRTGKNRCPGPKMKVWNLIRLFWGRVFP